LTANTTNQELYWSNRYGLDFSYDIPVPASQDYRIVLHMAELFWTAAGQRIFNITVEGVIRLAPYDIVADTGGRFRAKSYEYTEFIDDGDVSLRFIAMVDNAQVSGIEVFAA
jgi:Malectin domain